MPLGTELLLLADSETVGLLQQIIEGGASLILACVATLLGYFAYSQLQRNNQLERDFRGKIEKDAAERLGASETLLREMIDRDRESHEAVTATVQAVEGFTQSLKEQQSSCGEALKGTEELGRKMESAIDRLKSLEDEVRRLSNA